MRMAKIYITALATYYFRKEKTIWAKGMKTLCRRDCDVEKLTHFEAKNKGMKTLCRRDCDLAFPLLFSSFSKGMKTLCRRDCDALLPHMSHSFLKE